jgi:hypothetical protein
MFSTHFFICRLLQCIQWVYFIALNKLFSVAHEIRGHKFEYIV